MSVAENKIFYLVCDKNYSFADCAYLRSTISSEEEAENFVEKLSEKTNTNWIYRLTNKSSSLKFVFHRTWLCHLSLPKTGRLPSQGVRCSAKIVIFIRKQDYFTQEDRYLYHKPPLPCVICISTLHTHGVGIDGGPRLACLTEEVKKKFYDFFESGLTAIKAKKRFDAFCKFQKGNHKLKEICTPTIRQTQCLYNHWFSMRTSSLKLKSGEVTNSVTLEDFLVALPRIKKPVLLGRTTFYCCLSSVKSLLFPMNFVSMNSFGNIQTFPNQTYPLLFKLKWTIDGVLPPHVLLQVYEVRIDCSNCKAGNTLSVEYGEKTSKPVPEIQVQFPIKEEPMDCSELDSLEMPCPENLLFEQKSRELQQNTSAPVIVQDCLCENNCIDSKISSQFPFLNHDCIGAKKFRLPFVFTSVCSRDSLLKTSFSTLYTLRHGPNLEYVTQNSTSQILSVEINSEKQATLNIQTCPDTYEVEPFSLTKVPLSVSVKIEQRERVFCRSNVVSSPIVALRQPLTIFSSMSSRKDFINSIIPTNRSILEAKSSRSSCISKDDDYEFLVSLLPAMKKLSHDQKNQVKEKIQTFVTTCKMCVSRMNFEESSTMYRDCGVLPILRDFKF